MIEIQTIQSGLFVAVFFLLLYSCVKMIQRSGERMAYISDYVENYFRIKNETIAATSLIEKLKKHYDEDLVAEFFISFSLLIIFIFIFDYTPEAYSFVIDVLIYSLFAYIFYFAFNAYVYPRLVVRRIKNRR